MSVFEIRQVFGLLFERHGPQGWWPGGSVLDIVAGAVLVQNTRWRNAELGINRLRAAGIEDIHALTDIGERQLADIIRPAGTYRVKAARLQGLCRWLTSEGPDWLEQLECMATAELRRCLLSVAGIGPETADVLLVYLFKRPVFIADAYARRILRRLDARNPDGYEAVRQRIEAGMNGSTQEFNELHALLVRHAKEYCRVTPVCAQCVLARHCAHARSGKLVLG